MSMQAWAEMRLADLRKMRKSPPGSAAKHPQAYDDYLTAMGTAIKSVRDQNLDKVLIAINEAWKAGRSSVEEETDA